jgi:hypothetical protein
MLLNALKKPLFNQFKVNSLYINKFIYFCKTVLHTIVILIYVSISILVIMVHTLFMLSDYADGFERSFQEDMVQPKPASSSETFGNVEQASPAVTSGIEFQGRKDGIFFPKTCKSINVKYLRESIDRSRNIRASLAAFIALVVAIQHVLLSHGITWGTVLSIWLFSWPIGIILLTDVSAIIMPLVLWNQLQYKQEEDVDSASKDTDGETNKFLKAVSHLQVILNAGLLLKQIGDAIFLDCSIYVVVLIFSLNLGQYPFSR